MYVAAASAVEQSSQLMGLNWLRLIHKWEIAREWSKSPNQKIKKELAKERKSRG